MCVKVGKLESSKVQETASTPYAQGAVADIVMKYHETYHTSSNETAQSVTIGDSKPLLYHLIDVTAVAEAFLQRNPARLAAPVFF